MTNNENAEDIRGYEALGEDYHRAQDDGDEDWEDTTMTM